jgi:hypothetical protein
LSKAKKRPAARAQILIYVCLKSAKAIIDNFESLMDISVGQWKVSRTAPLSRKVFRGMSGLRIVDEMFINGERD